MRAVNIDMDKAERLYESGMSTDSVALELGISGSTLRRLFRRAGYQIRKPGNSGNRKRKPSAVKVPKPTRICACCGHRMVPTRPIRGVTLTRLCAQYYLGAEPEVERHENFSTPSMVNY